MRDFLLANFSILLEEIEGIPVKILLDPIIKQLQIHPISLNLFDFVFFNKVSIQSTLEVKQAVLLADIISRIYMNDYKYNKPCF